MIYKFYKKICKGNDINVYIYDYNKNNILNIPGKIIKKKYKNKNCYFTLKILIFKFKYYRNFISYSPDLIFY
ncbi:hypothetical protein [Candidatus Vidania fulgoroideorum]